MGQNGLGFPGGTGGGPWLCKASRTWLMAGKPCSQPEGQHSPLLWDS